MLVEVSAVGAVVVLLAPPEVGPAVVEVAGPRVLAGDVVDVVVVDDVVVDVVDELVAVTGPEDALAVHEPRTAVTV